MKDIDDIVGRVIGYLNQKTKKNFRVTTKPYIANIAARLKEGYTEADFIKVIDIKCSHWLHDPQFANNLNPMTLFRPCHFDVYLNQGIAKQESENALSGLFKEQLELLSQEIYISDYIIGRAWQSLQWKLEHKQPVPETGIQMQDFIRRVMEYQSNRT